MNPEFPITDEILSAFLDGELPEAERRQVEAWLESSPQARRELADLRQIGTLVRSIPRPSVPEGFQTELMQRVEREASDVLVQRPPRAGEASQNGRIPASGASSSSATATGGMKGLLAGFISLAAAAGIILAVGIFLQNQGNEGNVAMEEGARNAMPDSEQVFDTSAEESDEEAIVLAPQPSRDVDPSAMSPPSAVPPEPEPPFDASSVAADIPPVTAEMASPVESTAMQRMLTNRFDSTIPLTPGEMTEFFGEVAGEAVVVELICVDVNEVANTSNQLQVLLAANGIRPASEYGLPIDQENFPIAEGEQVLIYVEADEATVAATLEQMNEMKGVVAAEVNYLVEYPVLDGNVTEQLRQGLGQVSQIYGTPFIAQNEPAPGALESPSDPSRTTQTDSTDAQADAASGEIAGSDAPGPADPSQQELTANGAYVVQNADEGLIGDIEIQQQENNSNPYSRSQMNSVVIADNLVYGGEEPVADAAIEGEADAVIPPLPVQFLFVLKAAMPPIAVEAGQQ
jgi:hypothetical protein